MRPPFPRDRSIDASPTSRTLPRGRDADAYRRECELCERRTVCRDCHGLTVCTVCEREYLP